jgi:hypothetical protein
LGKIPNFRLGWFLLAQRLQKKGAHVVKKPSSLSPFTKFIDVFHSAHFSCPFSGAAGAAAR